MYVDPGHELIPSTILCEELICPFTQNLSLLHLPMFTDRFWDSLMSPHIHIGIHICVCERPYHFLLVFSLFGVMFPVLHSCSFNGFRLLCQLLKSFSPSHNYSIHTGEALAPYTIFEFNNYIFKACLPCGHPCLCYSFVLRTHLWSRLDLHQRLGDTSRAVSYTRNPTSAC